MKKLIHKLLCKLNIHWTVIQGGGAHFGDDLWTCTSCARKKYPEVFGGIVIRKIKK